jgi:thiamine-phosphate pyrophosphorylase
MEAGEAGADYLAFSGPDAAELTAWWAEVFEPPCVAFGPSPTAGVTDPHDVLELAACRADFVAVAMPAAQTAGDIGDFVRACAEGLNLSDAGASA